MTISALITATATTGVQKITWVISSAPASPAKLKAIQSIVNETSATTAFKETSHSPYDSLGGAVTSIVLDESYLPLGKKSFVRFEFIYDDDDKTTVLSDILVLTNKKVPNTPVLNLSVNIRAEDSGVSLKLDQYGTSESVSDGFSAITKATVLISKVGGTLVTDFKMIDVDIASYADWYFVNTTLTNDVLYELAVKVKNSVGDSLLSNTVNFSPKDTPAQITNVDIYTLLSEQTRKSQTTSDFRGDIVIYWKKPSDYDTLLGANRRVLSYNIKEQLYADVQTPDGSGGYNTTSEPSGESTNIELSIPVHLIGVNSGASFELQAAESINSIDYNYKYVINGSSNRLGKQFKYELTAINTNGNGPSSDTSPIITPFSTPDLQICVLEHMSSESFVTTEPIVLFDGKMKMKIMPDTLAPLNGGVGYSSDNATYTYPAGYPKPQDEELYLKILKESDSSIVYEGLNKFVQTVTSVTSGLPSITTYTPTGEYILDFTNVTVVGEDEEDVENLNATLQNGIKYRFQLYRQNKDPVIPSNEFKSQSFDTLRTKFKSPAAVSKIMSYAINDDLTQVKSGVSPAILVRFDQLSSTDLNGLDVFNSEIKYYAYQQSSIVQNLSPIIHNTQLTTREFIISQAAIGNQVANYIRTTTWNPELEILISGTETTPSVSETAITHPNAITALIINKTSSNTVTIGFTRQSAANLGGSLSANVGNRIMIFKDGDSTPVSEISVAHSSIATYVSSEITLENGKTYSVFVNAERYYTKPSHDGTGYLNNGIYYRFHNVIFAEKYYTENFVMTGTPTSPENIELMPTNSDVSVYYDEPSDLSGIPPSALTYHFFMNSDFTDFPNYTSNPQVFQTSIADVAGSSIATITKAYTSKALSNNRVNTLNLLPDTEYKFCMRVNATIGGNTLIKTNYSKTITTGYLNDANLPVNINLNSNPLVPTTTINGSMSNAESIFISDLVPQPEGVFVTAAENVLKIEFLKDMSQTINDVQIVINNNDGLGVGNILVPMFDTRNARSAGSSSGLFNLETWSQQETIADNASDFLPYNFKRINVNGIFKYQLQIPSLVNGRSYEVSIKFIKNINGSDVFSKPFIINRAPEAPATPPQYVKFDVASQRINLSWEAPANAGGASIGSNGALKYRIFLLSALDVELSRADTSNLNYSIVTNLVDATNYKVTIAALYTKGTDNSDVVSTLVQANSAAGNLIRPGPAPLGPIVSVGLSGTSNTITGSITLAGSVEMTSYPLNRIDVYIRHKSIPANKVLVQSFAKSSGVHAHGLTYTVNALAAGSVITLSTINAFATSGISPNTIGHLKPLNGFQYELVVDPVVDYTYAQSPPQKIPDVFPFGKVNILSAVAKPNTASKVYTIQANLNGSGSINNIISLGKGLDSPSIMVNNSAGGTLPSIILSGALDNTTAFVAANNLATFETRFDGASGVVNDLLVIVATQNSSDVFVHPSGGASHFD